MQRRLLALGLAAVLAAGGAITGGGSALAETAPPSAMLQAASGLTLQARTVDATATAGQVVIIEVTAKNTSDRPLSYWLPTPCDSPFTVSVQAEQGGLSGTLPGEKSLGQREPAFCIQVVKQVTLEPGQAVTERFAWDTRAAGPGAYTLTVQFAANSEEEAAVALPTQFPLRLAAPGATGAPDLPDTRSHWAADAIRAALQAGYVNGYPDGSFRPDAHVTRAELVKMLVLATGLPLRHTTPSFADVADHWVEVQGYLEAAVEAGLLHPEEYAALLAPDTPLTRRETAAMLVRALGQEGFGLQVTADQLPFTDRRQIPPWSAGFVMAANVAGLVRGYADNTFRPDRPVTRAEAVTMVARLLQAVAVRLEPDARLQVDGLLVKATGLAVKTRYPHIALPPLDELAAAASIRVAEAGDGWLSLKHGDKEVRIKGGVYGMLSGGARQPLNLAAPVRIGGKLYVPEAALRALGLAAHYDMATATFVVSTTP